MGGRAGSVALAVPVPSLGKTKALLATSSHLLEGSLGPVRQRQSAFHLWIYLLCVSYEMEPYISDAALGVWLLSLNVFPRFITL